MTGSRHIKEYQLGKMIGKGGFGKVFECYEIATGFKYAIKIMSRSWLIEKRLVSRVEQEITLHESLQHPNIVKMITHFEDSKYIYIVMEMCNGGNLYQYLRRNPKQNVTTIKRWFREIVTAINHMHELDIVHRDIKLSNILISDSGSMKIGDFGLASQTIEHEHHTICGTPNYMAPEVCIHDKYGDSYDPVQADLWSLGCLLYALFHGGKPLKQKRIYKRTSEIIDDNAHNLLTMLLSPVTDRPSANEILKHPFLTSNGSIEDSQRLSYVPLRVAGIRGVEHDFGGYQVRVTRNGVVEVENLEKQRKITVTEWMPAHYSKLQIFCAKAVDILRSATPKIILKANTPEPMIAAVVGNIGRVWFSKRQTFATYDLDSDTPTVRIGNVPYNLSKESNILASRAQNLILTCLQFELDVYRMYSGSNFSYPIIINEDQVCVAGVGSGIRALTGEVQVRLDDGTIVSLDKSATTVTLGAESYALVHTSGNCHLPMLPCEYKRHIRDARTVLQKLATAKS